MTAHKLTATQVMAARHSGGTAGDERLSDGGTLFLQIKASGAKSWVQVVRQNGRRHTIGLGGYPLVKLREAREAAFENRRLARQGKLRARATRPPTFEQAVEKVIAVQRQSWRGGRTEAGWRMTLRKHAYPRIGHLAVTEIEARDVLAVLEPIWTAKRETARRVRHRIGAVMEWAITHGHRTDNPAGTALNAALPRGGQQVRHHKALPYAEVADAIATVRGTKCWPATALYFHFLVLTATRSSEARHATWDEIDADAALWTIPAERTKMAREHRVPLSPQALAVLDEARVFRGRDNLVFPSSSRKPLTDRALPNVLKRQGVEAVPHGFRSSFRDWGAERTDAPREVLEAALAHVVGNRAEAAYARTDHLERRRVLMDQWGAYLVDKPASNGEPK